MFSRAKTSAAVAVVSALVATTTLAQERDFSNVEINATHVAGGVHMLTGAGGNIGVSVGDDGLFLIDDQFAPLTDKILAALAEISDEAPQFVLNTHWHFDHTGGNENLGEAGVFIVAHHNVRERMSVDQVMEAFDLTVEASPPAALPDITFGDAVTFHLNDETLHAVHVPTAHTDGDVIVHFASANVVHMGDVFFNGAYPFIDVGSGGTLGGVIAAVESTLERVDEATKIIPGHGPLADRGDLESYHDMLSTVRQRVADAVAAGQSEEEILAANLTSDLDEAWGGNADRGQALVRVALATLSDN